MGFFSWKTSDTKKSITNSYSPKGPLACKILCPDGSSIIEDNYEGYGVFGGKDIYQLVAKWNIPEQCNGDTNHDRGLGIDIACYDEDNLKLKFPIKIVSINSTLSYQEAKASISCPNQGFLDDSHFDN